MEIGDSVFFGLNDFEVDPNDGRRLCPRCGCCEVGVSAYSPPMSGEKSIGRMRILSMRYMPTAESLLRDPTGVGEEAWFCKGGCNERGEHLQERRGTTLSPSLVGRVKGSADAFD
jgi:hypothetical protein